MRLLFIRHGDPDYEKDSVTEKGAREIGLLADRLVNENIAAAYVSPLGRAQVTAQATLSRIGLAGTTCDWMREFDGTVTMPQTGEKHIFWDFLPSFLEEYPALYSPESWQGVPFVRESDVPQKYAEVSKGLDGVLAAHGYVRQGRHYAVTCANRDTLAFFLPFRRYVRHALASFRSVSRTAAAPFCRRAFIGNNGIYRGATGRRRAVPCGGARRYVASVCGERASVLFRTLLRGL